MLRNILRWAKVTKAGVSGENFFTQQLTYLKKTARSLIIYPYGLHGNAPADSLGLMMSVQDSPDNRAAIVWDAKNRPDLKATEVALYHPPTGSLVKWDADGNLTVTNGTAILTMIGNTVQLDGNLVINGTVTNNGKDIGDTHQHAQSTDGAGDSQATIVGVL